MSYTIHPKVPEIRMEAVRLVKYEGWSTRKTARHFGYDHSAVVRWCNRHPAYGRYGRLVIPTLSCRPHSHPAELPQAIVERILTLRAERHQCAEILHHRLLKEGVVVSLSSVKRVLKRHGCSRFSIWKKWHQYPPRPLPVKPGVLVEIDSVHEGVPQERVSAFALLDVHSRWGYAEPTLRATSRQAARFVQTAQGEAPFSFLTVQTDHGSEFSKWFTKVITFHGIAHRHSRVRTPTDNAHVERFIQTLQKECLHRIPRSFRIWQKEIPEFLHYYNNERIHMALGYKTPIEVVRSY